MKVRVTTAVVLCMLTAAGNGAFAAEQIKVKIVDRQPIETTRTTTSPTKAKGETDTHCLDAGFTLNCSSTSTTTTTPSRSRSHILEGAKITLQLPDDRLVVVGCTSKIAPLGRRSCRIPWADELVAEFNGDNAKLIWTASIDGKTTQSETYKILAVIDNR